MHSSTITTFRLVMILTFDLWLWKPFQQCPHTCEYLCQDPLNSSTEYRDTAWREIGVNGRTYRHTAYTNIITPSSRIVRRTHKNTTKLNFNSVYKVKAVSCLIKQYAQLSQRDRAAGCVIVSPKVEDWNWETIFYEQYRSIINHCDIIGLKICRILWKNAK